MPAFHFQVVCRARARTSSMVASMAIASTLACAAFPSSALGQYGFDRHRVEASLTRSWLNGAGQPFAGDVSVLAPTVFINPSMPPTSSVGPPMPVSLFPSAPTITAPTGERWTLGRGQELGLGFNIVEPGRFTPLGIAIEDGAFSQVAVPARGMYFQSSAYRLLSAPTSPPSGLGRIDGEIRHELEFRLGAASGWQLFVPSPLLRGTLDLNFQLIRTDTALPTVILSQQVGADGFLLSSTGQANRPVLDQGTYRLVYTWSGQNLNIPLADGWGYRDAYLILRDVPAPGAGAIALPAAGLLCRRRRRCCRI